MITMTKKIQELLEGLSEESKNYILKQAWNACQDGEFLSRFTISYIDPWDGNHGGLMRDIENRAVEEALKTL